MKELFHGELEKGRVIVKDSVEAGKIHNRGNFGRFESGALILSPVEALYLMNEGKLVVSGYSTIDFLTKAMEESSDFEIRYLAYRDLRKRGFIVKDTGREMWINRGGESERRALFPVYERMPFDFDEIYSMVSESMKIFGIVDGDGDMTYYSIAVEEPKGPVETDFHENIEILLMAEMGITDSIEIHRGMFYGKNMDGRLILSNVESIYLAEKGIARLIGGNGKEISLKDALKHMMQKDPEFSQKYAIYSDLRDRGLIVKTGFKYGTHFRVYVRDIEHHAPYLVHAVPEIYVGTWPEISRGVRLAHGVKKDFLLAEASNPPKYLNIKRVRL